MSEQENKSAELPQELLSQFKMGKGGKKPYLKALALATINGCKVEWEEKVENNEKRAWFRVSYSLDKETEDGFTEFCENYNFRIRGSTWIAGAKGITGKFVALVRESFGLDSDATLEDICNAVKGKQAYLISQDTEFGGEKYHKNVVRQFKM